MFSKGRTATENFTGCGFMIGQVAGPVPITAHVNRPPLYANPPDVCKIPNHSVYQPFVCYTSQQDQYANNWQPRVFPRICLGPVEKVQFARNATT